MQHKIGIKEILMSEGSWGLKLVKLFDYLPGGLLAFFLLDKDHDVPCPQRIRRILVIRPGGMGDAVFLMPILKKIKQKQPNIKVDILCQSRNKEVFDLETGIIDNIYLFPNLRVWQAPYDVLIDTEQWHYLSGILSYFLNAYSIGFATRPLRKKLYNKLIAYDCNGYELENFKSLFDSVFPEVKAISSISCSIDIEEPYLSWAKQFIPQGAVCVAVGGTIALRRFTKEELGIIAKDFIQKDNSVVFLGGRDSLKESFFIEKNFSQDGVFNAIAKFNLKEIAAIIKTCCRFIGHDSGLMHLALAIGVSTTAIFGSGNQKKWIRQEDGVRIISCSLPCSPCTIFGYTTPRFCHKKYFCLKNFKKNVLGIL